MTFIRFISRIDPTWNQSDVDKRPPLSGRKNVVATRRKDSLPPDEVCNWMNYWGFCTIRAERQKLAKNHVKRHNSLE